MTKRKLTHQQTHRIAAIQQQRIDDDDLESGILISRFGENALVADPDWNIYNCKFRQNLPNPVPGDKVVWLPESHQTGVITALQPRQTTLYRVNYLNETKPIAANISQMVITIAAIPEPQSELVDRYIIAAENAGFSVLLAANKSDLTETEKILPLIARYQKLGYATMTFSALNDSDLSKLQARLQNHVSIFIGQSGVGKSSIIQQLLPEEHLLIGKISDKKRGMHTTTTTTLYRLKGGGKLVDSPGVRQFRLYHTKPQQILQGFKEIAEMSSQCKFRNCGHANEAQCAVQMALKTGAIDSQRFYNWQRITQNP